MKLIVTVKRTNEKPRIAVVSPFLDRKHGTERIVLEWISRLATKFDIHVYSQRVEGLEPSCAVWHRIPKLPGPLLLNFLWWFAANYAWRLCDRRFRGLRPDLVFSPGINCLDVDVISVHIVFAEFLHRAGPELDLHLNSPQRWPRLIHRKLYYRLAIALERLAYTNRKIKLIHMSRKTAVAVEHYYGRAVDSRILYIGLDHQVFQPARRGYLRAHARGELGIPVDRFVLLIIGNDWRNKGVPALLEALGLLLALPIDVLIVGRDDPAPFRDMAVRYGLGGRVRFLPLRSDVEFYYAAADGYVGPSLEDAYSLPPFEAMACGLPVIVSANCGVSEIITNRSDGLILSDANDATMLASLIREIYSNQAFRNQLGTNAAQMVEQYTWENNARDLARIFKDLLWRKTGSAVHSLENA